MPSINQTKELNALLEKQNKLFETQARIQKSQLLVMRQMIEVFRQFDMGKMSENVEAMDNAIKEANKAVDELGQGSQQTMEKMNDSAKKASDNVGALGKKAEELGEKLLKLAPAVAALEGMVGGFKLTFSVMGSVLSLSRSLVSTFFNLAGAIIAMPFKLLSNLMGEVGTGSTELRQAFEDIRKEFGDLAKNESKAIIDAWRSVDHFGGRLAETGLSIWRTMGNMAESMKAVAELAKNMGVLFGNLQNQLRDNVERLFVYVKGLGLSEEAQMGLARTSQATGVELTELGRQITSSAFAMGDAFGINGKLISRDIGDMMSDFENFGGLAVQELANISVFARKLGVEIKGLLGVVNKFDNFEDAATSVAQLSQAFGLQLDTLKLVQAQDPAERIEMLRKSFFAAGKSIENMTRQERALLQQQTGLDANTARLVFSLENQGLSYEQIQKQGASAEKQQLTQAEAMQKLANSIERLVKSGPQMQRSFFDIFFQGFVRGIRWTREFWGLMRNLRQAMRATFRAGREVGQAFVKSFPGISQFLTGIKELFNPEKFREMTRGVVQAFRNFFEMMTTDPRTALPRLLDKLKENFFNWFSSRESAGQQILNGFKTFVKALGTIIGGLLREAMKGLTKAFQFLTDIIRDPSSVARGMEGATDGFLGFLKETLAPVWDALVEQWPRLWEAFKELLSTAWQKVQPFLVNFIKENLGTILLIAFGPAALGAVIRGVSFQLGGVFLKIIAGAVGKGFLRKATKTAAPQIGQAIKSVADAAGTSAQRGVGAVAAAGEAIPAAERAGMGAQRSRVSAGAIGKMVLLAAVIAVGLVAIVAGMVLLAEQIQKRNLTTESINNSLKIMLAAGGVMIEIALVAGIIAVAGQALKASLPSILLGAVVVGAIGAGMAFGATKLIDAFKDYDESDIRKTVTIMDATSKFFLVASLVAGIAAAIGMAIIASYGLGAVVIITGLATLGAIISNMVDVAKEVLEKIKEIEIGAGVDQKVRLFLEVIEKIGSFAANIASIAAATRPGITSLFSEGDTMVARLYSVTELIRSLGRTIEDLILTIVNSVKDLATAPGDLERASIISDILGSIGSLAENLKLPDSIADPGFFSELFGANADERIESFGKYATDLLRSLQSVVSTIGNEIRLIAAQGGFTAETIEAAKAIGQILSSIGQLARSMTIFISREFATIEPEKLRELAPVLGNVIDAMMNAIIGQRGDNIFTRIGNVIRIIVDSIKGLSSAQVKRLKDLSPIIVSTFTAISGIAAVIGNLAISGIITAGASPEQIKGTLDQIISFANSLTTGAGGAIGNVINALATGFGRLEKGSIENMKSGAEIVKSLFESVGSILTTLKNFKGAGTWEEARQNALDGLKAVYTLFIGTGAAGPWSSLSSFMETVPSMMARVTAAKGNIEKTIPGFDASMVAIDTLLKKVNAFFETDAMKKVSEINDSTVERVTSGVRGTLQGIEDIANSLKAVGGRIPNLNAELQALHDRTGLKGGRRLTIRTEPVTLNLNFKVEIDAEELENVLVTRKGSRIKI